MTDSIDPEAIEFQKMFSTKAKLCCFFLLQDQPKTMMKNNNKGLKYKDTFILGAKSWILLLNTLSILKPSCLDEPT